MPYLHSEWRGRLDHWINTLQQDIYLPLQKLALEGFTVKEHLTPQQAVSGAFAPMAAGTNWGAEYEYCWLRTRIKLPGGARGERIAVNLPVGSEATIFVNGKAFGTYRASWVYLPLHFICDNWLTQSARAGQTFDLLAEAYAGHFYPESSLGGCATGPVLPGSYQDPKRGGARATIGDCSVGIWNEEGYQLLMDVLTLKILLEQIDPESLRADRIAAGLEQFTLAVDFEQPLAGRRASYAKARKILAPLLQAKNGTSAPDFYAVGNAHLDLAWLWPMEETHRKTARTFAAQLRLLDAYPDYRFLQSQPASYAMCKQYYPELYARIKTAIAQSRWIAEGAMYVEPDTNMTSGESLIRQLVHGKRFFQEEFGIDSQLLWLPDTFGYSAALPQILRGCGIKYLVTQKIFWSYNEGDRFPYHYFTWQGADGSTVDSFLPTSYTYRTDPSEVCEVWKSRVQKRGLDAFLFPFGYGDGGGGPCRDHIELALRQKDLEGAPKVRMESPLSFFHDMEKKGGPQHTYVGELYFSAHRGVYTSQAHTKRGNRKGELALRQAEWWGALAAQQGFQYDGKGMDALWKLLLLNQFHDILPGSSIGKVYERAEKDHAHIIKQADAQTARACKALVAKKAGVSIFNALSFARRETVWLDERFAQGSVDADGIACPVQKTPEGVLAQVDLPACGAISLMPKKSQAAYAPAKAKMTRAGAQLENEQLSVCFNRNGEITSLVDTKTGREFAVGPMNRFLLYKDVPRLFDAWDIDSNYELQPVEITSPVALSIGHAQGLRASLILKRKILDSVLEQEIRLDAGSRRVDFVTRVQWHELHRLLKVSFPVAVSCQEGINEIQFGYIRRPTHRSRVYDQDRFEVCNQRYSAVCDAGHGAAVLNDCKYGISMHSGELRLTLLRATASPQMRADNGLQEFTYSFLPFEGSFADSDVVREAYALNVPAQVAAGGVTPFSAFEVDAPNVFIDTIKPAEDGSGDIVLRLYEAMQCDCQTNLAIHLPVVQASACDMLENVIEQLNIADGAIALHFRPFEVKTIRLHTKKGA